MKKSWLPVSVLSGLLLLMISGLLTPFPAAAEVSVSVTVPLPPLFIPAPPGLIVVPESYVYYPPDVDVEIFFYRGYWYRPFRGGWYIASSYNGPWRTVAPRRIPRAVIEIPHEYRRIPPGHERVPYGQVKKNWRSWENERRWGEHKYERSARAGKAGPYDGRDRSRGRGHEGRGRHAD